MSTVSFNDNLYGDSQILRGKGAGLKAFVRTGFWHYSRHDDDCKPGMWLVGVCGGGASDGFEAFAPLTYQQAHAVVDDFGNLRRVQ